MSASGDTGTESNTNDNPHNFNITSQLDNQSACGSIGTGSISASDDAIGTAANIVITRRTRIPTASSTAAARAARARRSLRASRTARENITNVAEVLRERRPPRAPSNQRMTAATTSTLMSERPDALRVRIRALEDTIATQDADAVALKRAYGRTLLKLRALQRNSTQVPTTSAPAHTSNSNVPTLLACIVKSNADIKHILKQEQHKLIPPHTRIALSQIAEQLSNAAFASTTASSSASATADVPHVPPPSSSPHVAEEDDRRSVNSGVSSTLFGEDRALQLDALIDLVEILEAKLSTPATSTTANTALSTHAHATLSRARHTIARALSEELESQREDALQSVLAANAAVKEGGEREAHALATRAEAQRRAAMKEVERMRQRMQVLEKMQHHGSAGNNTGDGNLMNNVQKPAVENSNSGNEEMDMESLSVKNAQLKKELADAKRNVARLVQERNARRRSAHVFSASSTPQMNASGRSNRERLNYQFQQLQQQSLFHPQQQSHTLTADASRRSAAANADAMQRILDWRLASSRAAAAVAAAAADTASEGNGTGTGTASAPEDGNLAVPRMPSENIDGRSAAQSPPPPPLPQGATNRAPLSSQRASGAGSGGRTMDFMRYVLGDGNNSGNGNNGNTRRNRRALNGNSSRTAPHDRPRIPDRLTSDMLETRNIQRALTLSHYQTPSVDASSERSVGGDVDISDASSAPSSIHAGVIGRELSFAKEGSPQTQPALAPPPECIDGSANRRRDGLRGLLSGLY